MTKFINLFAGPGASKSTTAAGVFSKLKIMGYDVELVPEFAKALVWENHGTALSNQSYVTANQFYQIHRLDGQCEYVISDSPVFLGAAYVTSDYPECYIDTLKWWHNQTSTTGYNFFINRTNRPFTEKGRVHSEYESKMLDSRIISLLNRYDIDFTYLDQNTAIDTIVTIIGKTHEMG